MTVTRDELQREYPNASEDVLKMLDSKTIQGEEKDSATLMPEALKGHKKAHPHQDFINQIVELAHLSGWKVVYWRPARVMRKGQLKYETPLGADGKDFPDLFLIRVTEFKTAKGNVWAIERKMLFWEVKIPPDKVRPGQQAWLDLLGGRVVTPNDWEWIVKILSEVV